MIHCTNSDGLRLSDMTVLLVVLTGLLHEVLMGLAKRDDCKLDGQKAAPFFSKLPPIAIIPGGTSNGTAMSFGCRFEGASECRRQEPSILLRYEAQHTCSGRRSHAPCIDRSAYLLDREPFDAVKQLLECESPQMTDIMEVKLGNVHSTKGLYILPCGGGRCYHSSATCPALNLP